MLRLLPDVKGFKSLQVHFWFKRSQEAVKEPALMQAAQQAKAQCVQVSHFSAGRCLSPSLIIPVYLLKF